MPTESEWKIMEQLWNSSRPLTTIEIQKGIEKHGKMSLRTVRVLTSRLLTKGIITYEVDKDDARVYHYRAVKSKEECVRYKSKSFIDSYFAGSQTGAFAALLETCELTDEQYRELENVLESSRKKGGNPSC